MDAKRVEYYSFSFLVYIHSAKNDTIYKLID